MMQGRSTRSLTLTATVVASLALLAAAALAQPATPRVMLNGQPLEGGDKLVAIEGALLLPMQTIFDAIGASANYLPNEQHKISVVRGDVAVNMWLGSTMLTVKDRPVAADVSPTMVGQTIYVPLKAVVEAFGGSIVHDVAAATAYISLAAHIDLVGPGRPGPDAAVIKGVILQTYPGAETSLLVRNDDTGATQLVALARNCRIVRGTGNETPAPARASDLQPGDLVEITMARDNAVRITATIPTPATTDPGAGPQLQHMRVEILGVAGRYLLLPGGNTLMVADNANVLDQNGRVMALSALQPMDRVLVIIDTTNNFAVRIVREATAGVTQRDTTPPTFINITPDNNAVVRDASPLIVARFSDEDSGINRAATTMLLNGEDVTAQATVTEDRIEYQAMHLPDGDHQLDFTITDKAGNTRRRQWSITVLSPSDQQILAVSHNADKPLVAGELLEVTVKVARPGGQAVWAVGDWKTGMAMQRFGATNTYTGSYLVAQGDRVTAPVTVRYRPPESTWQEAVSETDVVIGAAPAGELKVTRPQPDEVAPDNIVVAGTATPGHQVRVKIRYNKQRFFDMSHDLPEQTVTADANGQWQTQPVNADQGLYGRADSYDVRAELLRPGSDEVLNVVNLTLRGK